MRTLVITDSTGMANPKLGIRLQDTYDGPGRIGGDIERLSGGGYPIKEFHNRINNFASYIIGPEKEFNLGVIGLGLADCAPRPIPPEVRSKVGALPFPLNVLAIKTLHILRPALVTRKLYQYTPIDEFTYYYSEILNIATKLCKLVAVIEIAPVKESVNRHSPYLNFQIALYNQEIGLMASEHANVKLIELSELADDENRYLTDDAHLTLEGHNKVWSKLHKVVWYLKLLEHNEIPIED